MDLKYICPHWGSESKPISTFFNEVLAEGYNGVEINLDGNAAFVKEFMLSLERARKQQPYFNFIAQSVPDNRSETVAEHILRVVQRIEKLADFQPDFINSHTGKDYYTFDDNCRIIETIETVATKKGIKVYHETHRGRFSFHAASLLPYLDRFPEIELTADFSHWCTVSESMLEDQKETLVKIIPHISHLHARVGFEQAPQVNDPFAPEWQNHLEVYTAWWKKVVRDNRKCATITPEFGPAPYMPALPFTQQPIGNQWNTNAKMKNYLKKHL